MGARARAPSRAEPLPRGGPGRAAPVRLPAAAAFAAGATFGQQQHWYTTDYTTE